MTRLAVRNNNPLNIRAAHAGLAPWKGQSGQNEGFCTFTSPIYGFRAAAKILQTYALRGWVTPRQIVGAWAPPNENDTGSYLNDVCSRSALPPDRPVDRADWPQLIRAMATHESGGWYFTTADLTTGIALA